MDIKSLKKNKTFSYVSIVIAYIIAAIIGIVIGTAMTGESWINVLVASLVSMIVIFIFSTVFKNNSFFTPFWGVMPVIVVLSLAFSSELSVVRFLLMVAVTAWGVCTVVNWAKEFKSLKREDWRTIMVRRKSGSIFGPVNFIALHLIPTLINYLCVLPVILCFSEKAEFSILSVLFILIAIGGLVIETYANYHLHIFRLDQRDGYVTGCCRYGIWCNARHPNYFGEMVFWWAIALAVIFTMPSKWFVFVGPLALTVSFIMIGMPLMEGHLRTKGGHSEYFRLTRKLLPIPLKSEGRK